MFNENINILVIIPSLEPDNKLLQLLESLQANLQKQENPKIQANILIVDDGSGVEYFRIFEQAQKQYGCELLRHAVNLGKGRALKTAFNYFLNNFSDFHGVVTVDSDGQHTSKDIIRCIKELSDGNSLILGCRDFNSKNVPFKSLIGNKITRKIFGFLCGIKVSDTQTGLRAIPTELVRTMISIPGERFEYEMNMLAECGNRKIKISEVPIDTIYSQNNKGTHFNPILDSIRIYKIFVKYAVSAISSSLIDIALFTMFVFISKEIFLEYILFSTIVARIFSSLYNYLINRKIVFAGNQGRNTLLKYYALSISIMIISGFSTTFLFNLTLFNEVGSKVFVDMVLFLLSYYVQKKWIF